MEASTPDGRRGRLASAAAFYAFATGLSRIAGIVREIVVASYYGVSAAMSAFAVAAQIPMLVRGLFAEGALQAGFVPVFTELLAKGKRAEAFRVASSMITLICAFLGAVTALFILLAPVIIPVVAPGFADDEALKDLTTGLAIVMFPSVILVALTGLVAGMLNALDHFNAPAIAPLAWNVGILVAVFALTPLFEGDDRVYAYAIGVLIGTVAQLLVPLPWLRGRGGRFSLSFEWRDVHVKRILKLMLPVTVTFGLINVNLLVNLQIGTLVSESAPAAIDKAFRLYLLPQGIFAVSIATILFPTIARLSALGDRDGVRRTTGEGIRQILLLMIPSAVFMAILAEPITRLVYQRGEFGPEATDLVSEALVWWAVAMPLEGAILMLSRAFFGLQRPWATAAVALANLAVNAGVALLLYDSLGIAGIVIGTVIGAAVMTVAQYVLLRRHLDGVEEGRTLGAAVRMLAAAALLGGVSYGVWYGLDSALGGDLWAQIAALGTALAAGAAIYAAVVWALRVPEAHTVAALIRQRLGR